MSKSRTRIIADDLLAHVGAAVSISALARYLSGDNTQNRGRAIALVAGLQPIIGQGTGKRYFYLDVAERLVQI